MGEIIVGIIMISIGALMTIKSEAVYDFVGPIEWAERKMGSSGGTRAFLKLLGVLMIILGMIVGFGWIGDIIAWIFPASLIQNQ